MEVRLVNHVDEIDRLRPAWEDAFAHDPHATPFMSWLWLRAWFEVSPYPGAVLAVRQGASSPWIGFMAISIRGSQRRFRLDQVREIHMGGAPGADYTGFVCPAGFEQPVISALANHLVRELPWDRLRLMEVRDPRLDVLLDSLRRDDLHVYDHNGTRCPYIALPGTWDEYLENSLTYDSRKSLRKKMRKVEQECRVTHLTADNLEQQIDALISLAGMRTRENPDGNLPRCRPLFQRCAAGGLTSVIIIWHHDTPIAGMGSFIDRKANSLGTYLTGFNEAFADYSPGRVVNALTIRHAIEQKFAVLDFLRGDEPYKLQFGAQIRHNRSVMVVKRGLNTATRMAMNRVRQRLNI